MNLIKIKKVDKQLKLKKMRNQKVNEITISFKKLENGKIIAVDNKSEKDFQIKITTELVNLSNNVNSEIINTYYIKFEIHPTQEFITNISPISPTHFSFVSIKNIENEKTISKDKVKYLYKYYPENTEITDVSPLLKVNDKSELIHDFYTENVKDTLVKLIENL